MNVFTSVIIVGVLLNVNLVWSQFFFSPSDILVDIGENREAIQKIFEKVSTINVLLKNYEQPEGIVQSLENIFKFGWQTFNIFNFSDDDDYKGFIKHCEIFSSDPSAKILYYERVYKKGHKVSTAKRTLQYFEDFEPGSGSFQEDPVDPQSPEVTKKKILSKSFSQALDRWYTYRLSGFVIVCPYDAFIVYLKCLVSRGGTYLFIIEKGSEKQNQLEDVFEVLKKAWKATTNIKLFVLIFEKLYIVNPFKIDENTKSYGILEKLSDGEMVKRDLKNLNKYPMNVDIFYSAYSVPKHEKFSSKLNSFIGPDVEAARFIEEQMNVSMSLVQSDGKFGVKLQNGTLTGALGNLQSTKSDIALTAFFMKDYDTRACEFTYPLYMDELCVVVKKAARIPPELLPLVIFDNYLWLSLFFVGILIGIVWSMLRFVNNIIKRPLDVLDKVEFYIDSYKHSQFLARQSQFRQFIQVFVDSLMLFLSVPMRRLSRVQNERIFMASVCLTSIIIVSLYQSGMSTIFVKPLYFKDINSLEQLDAAGVTIKVKYAGYLTDVFPNDTAGTFKNLHDKMLLVETEISAMDLVKDFDKVATITRKSTKYLDNSLYFMRKQLHMVEKECPKNYFLAYMVPTHSVFLERFNEILMDIQRYGFILKWIDDINYERVLFNTRTFVEASGGAKVLSLNDFKFPFLVLFGGSSCSIAVLATESYYYYKKSHKTWF